MNDEQITAAAEAWESGKLGNDPATIRRAEVDHNAINKSLNLVPISMRMQGEMLDDLKRIAAEQGLGYQPLMRLVLARYIAAYKGRQPQRVTATMGGRADGMKLVAAQEPEYEIEFGRIEEFGRIDVRWFLERRA